MKEELTNLLSKKRQEHGSWEANKTAFQALYIAAMGSDATSFHHRKDFGEINAILAKLARVVSKPPDNVSPDTWRDIAGYAMLRYSEMSKE